MISEGARVINRYSTVMNALHHKKMTQSSKLPTFTAMQEYLKTRWVYHSLIWIGGIVGLSLNYWLTSDEETFQVVLVDTWFFVAPLIPAVYLNFYLKNRLFDKQRYGMYVLLFPLQVGVGIVVYQLLYWLVPQYQGDVAQDVNNIFFLLLVTVGMQYLKREVINKYKVQELKTQKAESELNALKAQINPHFLFNTLNNIYATNQLDAEKGSEMILELADVMRYHLEFSRKEWISLAEEIQLIQAYIALERLRLRENCKLDIHLNPDDLLIRIAPLLLLPFIENAFKHGTHPTLPCFVSITIATVGNEMVFEVKNSVIPNKRVVKTEIGLENTLKRLGYMYAGAYDIDIQQDELCYTVKLNLTL